MRFWDASALVPLLVKEASTPVSLDLMARDPAAVVWWGSHVECVSALARLEREGVLDKAEADAAFFRLDTLTNAWEEIEPSRIVRDAAVRFLRVHALRAADALQLAAAFVAADRRPPSLEFVTFDDRLAAVARKEGFPLIDRAER